MHVERVLRILKQLAVALFAFAQRLFGLFSLRDVARGALVIQNLSIFISHGASVNRKPYPAAVFAKRLVLEITNDAVLFEQSFELFASRRIDVDLPRDITTRSDQFARRVEAVYARERRVRHQVIAFGRRLKDTLTDVFEDPAIFTLGSETGFLLTQQFLSLISREFRAVIFGVGRRLRSSPVSHNLEPPGVKVSVRERPIPAIRHV